MGWWNSAPDGSSLLVEETGLVWGDGPADVMDAALEEIRTQFDSTYHRGPTREELIAGLLFSLGEED